MLLRIATAVGIAFILTGVLYAVSNRRKISMKSHLPSVARVVYLSLGASTWLALTSTALIWIFPINVVLSGLVGYFGARKATSTFPLAEVSASITTTLAAGVSIAAALATHGDPFLLNVSAPYSLLNTIATAAFSYLALRQRPSEA